MIASVNVTSLEAHRRFWVSTLGATEAGEASAGLPGLRLAMQRAEPAGGTRGTPLDHLGFQVPDVRTMVQRVRAAGYPIVTRESLPASFDVDDEGLASIPALETRVAFTLGPDGIKTELLEYPGPPIALHHVHLFAPDASAMQAWYVRALGASPTMRGRFLSAEFAGVRMSFSQATWPLVSTKGRAIERLAFETADRAAARARLEAAGASVEEGPRSMIAADPWGTAIEIRG